MNQLIQPKNFTTFIVSATAVVCLGLCQVTRAISPPPDGGYPGANTAEGDFALQHLTSGIWNTANGFEALTSNTTGQSNTATGLRALFSNTDGSYNSATGVYALYFNTSGSFNNADGAFSLANNNASFNTATGYSALFNNTTGASNAAFGFAALYYNNTGSLNTGTGNYALFHNLGGLNNTANGSKALFANTTGNFNNAVGANALTSNVDGRARFLAISTAVLTLPLVISRSRAMIQPETPLETSTRPLAFRRSSTILMAIQTTPSGFKRSLPTPPVCSTKRLVLWRWPVTSTAAQTSLSAIRHSVATHTAGLTPSSAIQQGPP